MTRVGKTALDTRSRGVVGPHPCAGLPGRGLYPAAGVDDYSKCGQPARPHGPRPPFRLVRAGCSSDGLPSRFLVRARPHRARRGHGCSSDGLRSRFLEGDEAGTRFDDAVAGAAMAGGIACLHRCAYGLLAANERMLANTLGIALYRRRRCELDRIVAAGSSMAYGNAAVWPTPEGHERGCPATPPPAIARPSRGAASGEGEAESGSVRLPSPRAPPRPARGAGPKRRVSAMSATISLTVRPVVRPVATADTCPLCGGTSIKRAPLLDRLKEAGGPAVGVTVKMRKSGEEYLKCNGCTAEFVRAERDIEVIMNGLEVSRNVPVQIGHIYKEAVRVSDLLTEHRTAIVRRVNVGRSLLGVSVAKGELIICFRYKGIRTFGSFVRKADPLRGARYVFTELSLA